MINRSIKEHNYARSVRKRALMILLNGIKILKMNKIKEVQDIKNIWLFKRNTLMILPF